LPPAIGSGSGRATAATGPAGIAAALAELPHQDLVIDGEACAHSSEGLPDFHALRTKRGLEKAVLYAWDLLIVDGQDLRPQPLWERKARLFSLLAAHPDSCLGYVEHMDGDLGPTMFRHACRMGLEGIVSKRSDRPYRSGRVSGWLKTRCPDYRRRRR
jgi:bifunctional non-homologous end joining protein LigD